MWIMVGNVLEFKHNKFQESGLPTRRFLLYACLDLLDCSRMKDFLNKLKINKKADEFFLSSVYQLLTGFPVSLKRHAFFRVTATGTPSTENGNLREMPSIICLLMWSNFLTINNLVSSGTTISY